MKKRLSLMYSILFVCMSLVTYATKEKNNARINKSQINVGGSVSVMDNKYPNVNMSGSAFIAGSTGKITLGLDNFANTLDYFNASTGTNNFDISIGLSVLCVNSAGVTSTQTVELTIDHKNNLNPYSTDRNIAVFKGAHLLSASISYMKNSAGTLINSQLPSNLFIEAEIETERYYSLNITDVPVLNHNYMTVSNELEVFWNSVNGAEEYELEWTYVNSFASTSGSYDYETSTGATIANNSVSGIEFTFLDNATRIRTSKNSFKIPLNYDRGLLVYRIRAIGKNTTDISYEVIGNWSVNQTATTPVLTISLLGISFDDYYTITTGHAEDKNWQYTASFAEDGKKKDVIGYFDGSLRSRQTVTKTNTEDISIFMETIYDKLGRPTVQFLPAPSKDYTSKLDFYNNFNVSDNVVAGGFNQPYGKNDLVPPVSAGSCPYSPGPVLTNTSNALANGAGVYYSSYNSRKDNQDAYIPDAQKIPFSTTLYTSDNTGRIKYQSGVGPDHKIGSNHETKYLYGDPDQEDLDKLFGSEAGYKAHYKKNMVVDPNGQISVSYLNTENKVVATALAGNPPANVDPIGMTVPVTTNATYLHYNSADYELVNPVNNQSLVFIKKIIPDVTDYYQFSYDLTVPQFTDACVPGFCYDCVYDLDITLTDECETVLYSKTATVGLNSGVIDYTCSDPIVFSSSDPSYSPPFTVSLTAAKEYFLTKALHVNGTALSDYLNHYIANSAPTCVKTIDYFIDKETATIDQSGCAVSCTLCASKVNDYYALHNVAANADPNSPTYDPNYIYMSPGQKDLAIKKCMEPCQPIGLCQTQFKTLLSDVKPFGQYAQYNNVAGAPDYDASTYELSVFNESNYLRINTIYGSALSNNSAGNPFVGYDMTKKGYWRNPQFYNEATHDFTSPSLTESNENYFNPDGTVTKVRVTFNGTSYFPDIINTTSTYLKTDAQGLWTYAQNLKYLKDFIAAYNTNPNWAYSLVKFHPEFNYFLDCDRQSNPAKYPGFSGFTSDDFEAELRSKSTMAEAQVNPKWTLNLDNTVNDLALSDPYFNSGTNTSPAVGILDLRAELISRLTNYQGTGKTAKQVVAEMYYATNMYYSNCTTAVFSNTSVSCPACTGCSNITYTISTASLDKQWQAYRDIYLSEKQKLIIEQSHRIANSTYNINGFMNNYYNGAIGNSNFNEVQAFISYNFNIFPSYFLGGSIPGTLIYQIPPYWPNYPASSQGVSGPGAYQPPFARGFYDFGSPSSLYHKDRYLSKQKRFSDVQELYNNVSGGSSDPATLQQAADNNLYYQTGQCAIFKKLEFFISTLAGNGKLFNIGVISPLVTEPTFTQDLYDAIIGCGGLTALQWHQIGVKPVIVSGSLVMQFYDISSVTPAYLPNADITLTPSTPITTWTDIKQFSNINYNGVINASTTPQSAFAIYAVLQSSPSVAYTSVMFTGTTCIKNNCIPPTEQICKPTQQAIELQTFINSAIIDYNYSQTTTSPTNVFNLADPGTNSAQNFTALIRYPFGNTAVTQSPMSHSVTVDVTNNMLLLEGANSSASNCSNVVKVNYSFYLLPGFSGAVLNGVTGFSNIQVDPSTPSQFTVTALYSSTVSKKMRVNITYNDNAGITCSDCGTSIRNSCRQYVLSTCTPFIPSQCNTDEYHTAIDLQNLVNELKDIDFGTSVPISNLTSYTSLLSSQIGLI